MKEVSRIHRNETERAGKRNHYQSLYESIKFSITKCFKRLYFTPIYIKKRGNTQTDVKKSGYTTQTVANKTTNNVTYNRVSTSDREEKEEKEEGDGGEHRPHETPQSSHFLLWFGLLRRATHTNTHTRNTVCVFTKSHTGISLQDMSICPTKSLCFIFHHLQSHQIRANTQLDTSQSQPTGGSLLLRYLLPQLNTHTHTQQTYWWMLRLTTGRHQCIQYKRCQG